MIQFSLPIIPPKATSQTAGKRIFIPKDSQGRVMGNPRFFKNKQAVDSENIYLKLCAPHAPARPIEGPVKLTVEFVWPWRCSEPNWRRAHGKLPMTTKPDCSNAIKTPEDVLAKLGFLKNDSQIAHLEVLKFWGDDFGVLVTIQEIPFPVRTRCTQSA